MTWWQDGLITLITGGVLVVFRIWLEIKWKDKRWPNTKNPKSAGTRPGVV